MTTPVAITFRQEGSRTVLGLCDPLTGVEFCPALGGVGQTGLQGSVGLTGAQGLSGAAGLTGAQGLSGAVGPTGAQGLTGVQGSAGLTGAQGLSGAVGPTGAQGLTGAVGLTGAQGLTGASTLQAGSARTTLGSVVVINGAETANVVFDIIEATSASVAPDTIGLDVTGTGLFQFASTIQLTNNLNTAETVTVQLTLPGVILDSQTVTLAAAGSPGSIVQLSLSGPFFKAVAGTIDARVTISSATAPAEITVFPARITGVKLT